MRAVDVDFRWGVKIPLRDGVRLNATAYLPKGAASALEKLSGILEEAPSVAGPAAPAQLPALPPAPPGPGPAPCS